MTRRKRAKKLGPAGGLGARYGVRARRRYSDGFKFAGGAYQPRTKLGITAERSARSR